MVLNSDFKLEGLSSNWFNAINFVLFDLILLSCVFYFTTHISGCLNDKSIRSSHRCILYVTCPPLIGGGLTGTSPLRANVLMSIRVIGFVFVLFSNFMISGGSTMEKTARSASVLTLGSLEGMNAEQTRRAYSRRISCQGLTNSSLYFGELRNGTDCVLDRYIIAPPVQIAMKLMRVNFDVLNCENATISSPAFNITRHICSNAVMQCTEENICQGVVHVAGNLSFVCPLSYISKGMNRNRKCQKAWNLVPKSYSWIPGERTGFSSILDLIFASYGAVEEVRTVFVLKETPYTTITKLWLFLMFLKCMMVLTLLLNYSYLRHCGLRPQLHDERALLQLIEMSSPSTRQGGPPDFSTDVPLVCIQRSQSYGGVSVAHNVGILHRNGHLHDRELACV